MTNVLIVDDNEMQHDLFDYYALSNSDINLKHALKLEEAISIVQKNSIDLIFLDNRLTPYPDYTTAATIIRQFGYKGAIAVMSANIDDHIFSKIEEYSIAAKFDKGHFNFNNFDTEVSKVQSQHIAQFN